MAKKRCHELAKELNMENKDLIARLEKIGITVKSHASSLEDSEVEKIKEVMLAGESRQILEERIKSTVIRRRAVRAPLEAAPTAEEEEHEAEDLSKKQEDKAGKDKKEAPAKASVTPAPEAFGPPRKKIPKSEKEAAKEKPAADTAGVEKLKQQPAAVPSKPGVVTKHKIIRPETKGIPQKASLKPGEKIIIPPPEKSLKKEFDKAKKKGKAPVEVFMEEEKVVPRRKVLEKRIEKKLRKQDEDREVIFTKWRDEKKVAPVKMKKTEITVPKAIKRRIKIGETISVGDLAKRMGVKASEVINKLMSMGVMATINQSIDYDIASLVAGEFTFQVEKAELEFDESIFKTAASPENLKPRAPVVTIMGHVDHGKTSLLDAIRQSNVIAGEAGGITQAIGAYHVHINDRDIVFLDTPGHEAFTAMRARGGKVTDIVVLVVAADDGVMGQNIEAINHSKVAGVPIIVAINKIDKPGADSDKIKKSLSEQGLLSEQWGGETIFCEVSAKKKKGIEELLEMILLQADVMELKADPDRPARGVIIESKLDRGRGPVATVLIQEGSLKESDSFVSKTEYGRVRALINDQGRRVKEAGPSMPVEVIGFSSVPQVGAEFFGIDDEKKARNIAEYWIRKTREKELSASSEVTLEQLYQKIKEGVKDFNVIIKADVRGSVEAITDT